VTRCPKWCNGRAREEAPRSWRRLLTVTNDVSGVDPLVFARRQLIGAGVSGGHLYEVERRARHLVAEAESFAKAMLRREEPASARQPEPWSDVS
jgi:hypothetical protein